MKLYVISDTHIQNRYSHLDLAKFAKAAKVDFFQYREKFYKESVHYEELTQIRDLLKNSHTKLIINDDLELALKIDADGVHVGQEDKSLEYIFQEQLPPNFIVGATVHNENELFKVEKFPIHYMGVGPVFGTNSKKLELPPLGIKGLKHIHSLTSKPIFAIGNIQLTNYKDIVSFGVEGIVLLSAFVLADNPIEIIYKFRDLVQ